MKKVFEVEKFLPFQLSDPAGVLFFGHVFTLAHEVYELFVGQVLKISWNEWFNHSAWILPIKHTQATYYSPLKSGNSYRVELFIKKIGQTSFILNYHFKQAHVLFCEVETVHVFCDKKSLHKENIPPVILDKFLAIQ